MDVTFFISPGPSRILPGRCPGGIVIRIYDRLGSALLAETLLQDDSDFEAQAEQAQAQLVAARRANHLPPQGDIVWVVYDGDTGLRWGPEDYYAASGKLPGERL